MKLDFKTLLEEHSFFFFFFFFLEKIGDTSVCLLNMSLPMCPREHEERTLVILSAASA